MLTPVNLGLPGGSVDKESTCNVGDLGSIPGLGRSLGKGKGYPLQYSDLESSMDSIVHEVAKSQTKLSNFHFTTHWHNTHKYAKNTLRFHHFPLGRGNMLADLLGNRLEEGFSSGWGIRTWLTDWTELRLESDGMFWIRFLPIALLLYLHLIFVSTIG